MPNLIRVDLSARMEYRDGDSTRKIGRTTGVLFIPLEGHVEWDEDTGDRVISAIRVQLKRWHEEATKLERGCGSPPKKLRPPTKKRKFLLITKPVQGAE